MPTTQRRKPRQTRSSSGTTPVELAPPGESPEGAGSLVRVGCVEIDPRRVEIRVGSTSVTVEPRVFDFLLYLARHRDRLVSKQELLAEVWAGCHVSDAALARCASLARKALGNPGLIVTVYRRGYRWE